MPTATPTPSPAPISLLTPEPERCAGGRLRVGDLASVGDEWGAGVQSAIETARAWRPDARLVTMQVGCAPLEAGFRWQGTFYSQTAQSFFFSDTGMTEPAEVDPASVPALPIEEVNFRELHLALARAGYDEDAELNPATGATVRLNAPTDPFGPPDTPQGLVYYVAIAGQGTVQDLFVSSPGWTIHSYQDQRLSHGILQRRACPRSGGCRRRLHGGAAPDAVRRGHGYRRDHQRDRPHPGRSDGRSRRQSRAGSARGAIGRGGGGLRSRAAGRRGHGRPARADLRWQPRAGAHRARYALDASSGRGGPAGHCRRAGGDRERGTGGGRRAMAPGREQGGHRHDPLPACPRSDRGGCAIGAAGTRGGGPARSAPHASAA